MKANDIRLSNLINKDKRQLLYKEHVDPLMAAAQGYEKEGDQVKADEMWALWEAKRTEIRNLYPD